MKKFKKTLLGLSLSFPLLVTAHISPYLSLQTGANWVRAGATQTLPVIPPFVNTYRGEAAWHSRMFYGIQAGLQGWKNPRLGWRLGLGYVQTRSLGTGGVVEQFGDPAFTNLSYHYTLQLQRVLAYGRVFTTWHQRFHPYAELQMGVAMNKAYGYHETPLADYAVPMTPFASHTETSFTYAVGAGLMYDLTPRVSLEAGYAYGDVGRVRLGLSPAQTSQSVLTLKHLYTHTVAFAITVHTTSV